MYFESVFIKPNNFYSIILKNAKNSERIQCIQKSELIHLRGLPTLDAKKKAIISCIFLIGLFYRYSYKSC